MPYSHYFIILYIITIFFSTKVANAQVDSTNKVSNLSLSLEDVKLDTLLDKNKFTIKVNVATKTSVDLENTPGSVTVITRNQLQSMNLRTLRQVLNVYVPSLDVLPTNFQYGSPNDNSIYARGNISDFAQQVLILFNGTTKFNESTFGSAMPAMEFTLDNIERVEVSTTPTTVYGANAITVINIVTHEQFLDGAEANVNYGISPRSLDHIFQNQRYSISWGNTLNKVHVGASLQFYKDEGQFHNLKGYNGNYKFDENSLKDGTQNAVNLTLHLKDIAEKFEAGVWYKNISKDPFLNGFTTSQSNDLFEIGGQQFLTYFKFNGKKLNFNMGGLFSEYNVSIDRNSIPKAYGNRNYDLFAELSFIRKVTFAGVHELATGFRIEREGQQASYVNEWKSSGFVPVNNPEFVPNESRNVFSAYMEDNWRFTKNTYFLLGARADYFLGFKDSRTLAFNPRASIVKHFGKNIILKAIYARAFRAASIYELYGVGYKYLKGNSNIKPEVVTSIELNTIYRNDNLSLSVTPFLQIFESPIQFVVPEGDTSMVAVAINSSPRRVFGVEINTRFFLNDERSSYFFINGSYLIPNEKNEFIMIPRTYIGGGANFVVGKWNYNITAYYRGERLIPQNLVQNQKFGGYHFVGSFSLGYQANSFFNIYTLIENISLERHAIPLMQDGYSYPLRSPVINFGIKVTPF